MEKHNRIYIAGNRGLVGSAIHRGLEQRGYSNLLVRPHAQFDLTDRVEVRAFFEQECEFSARVRDAI
jgi:GDP-L-fucose synthase